MTRRKRQKPVGPPVLKRARDLTKGDLVRAKVPGRDHGMPVKVTSVRRLPDGDWLVRGGGVEWTQDDNIKCEIAPPE